MAMFKIKLRNKISILIVIWLLVNCKPIDYNLPQFHYEYFPIEYNSSKEYFVTEISHTSLGKDTSSYFLKEIFSDQFMDSQGDTCYKINRYWKIDSLDDYEIKDVWSVKKTQRIVEVVEENVRFIKLIFPIKDYSFWDGNANNSQDEQEYYIENIHENYSLNGYDFDSSINVIQNYSSNLIEYESAKEVYVRDLGLVYKENLNLNINNGDILDVNYGTEYVQELIDYWISEY